MQEEELLLVHEEDLPVQEEDLPAQKEDLLPVQQEGHPLVQGNERTRIATNRHKTIRRTDILCNGRLLEDVTHPTNNNVRKA